MPGQWIGSALRRGVGVSCAIRLRSAFDPSKSARTESMATMRYGTFIF
jgi:hypothetical protein